jgi:uncharacterized protein YdcH (DUF465 family)
MDKWHFIKLKSFYRTKEMVSKLKRPPTEWEKIFASYTSVKELITRIYREIKKLNSPKINESIKKWATELNTTFSKEEIQMAKKHMKKCSLSLAIKEMQIKTTLIFHLTTVRIAIIKNHPLWHGWLCGQIINSMRTGTLSVLSVALSLAFSSHACIMDKCFQ